MAIMARGNYTGISCINEHLATTYKHSKPETVAKYRGVLYQINGDVKDNGYSDNPRQYDEETIEFLLGLWKERDLAVSTKDWYLHILNRYLRCFDNNVIEEMGIDFGQDIRPNVNWLSDEEAEHLMRMEKTPLEDIVIHLELCLGLRVAEVCRLRLVDIHFDDDPRKCYVSVRGKGKGDGKWRSVPFHPDSRAVFDRWIVRRNDIIEKIHAYDPTWEVPEQLLIWGHYENRPTGGYYTERSHSLDRAVIHKVRDRAGFDFSNHTLRRTFGRTLYRAGIPIETISKLYGHDDTQTTIRYLGIDLDDMGSALARMYEYQYSKR